MRTFYENENINIVIDENKKREGEVSSHTVTVSSKRNDTRIYIDLGEVSFSSLILKLAEMQIDNITSQGNLRKKYLTLKAGISMLNNEPEC